MATAGPWSEIRGTKLHPSISSALTDDLKFPNMTPVQAAAIPPLLTCKDVCVDAETGSGKTLSFLVPIAQMVLFEKDMKHRRHAKSSKTVKAIVLVPTRELAFQVHAVALSLFAALPGNVTPVPLIGGSLSSKNGSSGAGPDVSYASDHRVIIATPGRLSAAIGQNGINYSKLEILIMDEADRLLDMGFSVTLTDILTRLPRQRRTGIYSATQTAEVEALARAGLRNPVRVAVRVRTKGLVEMVNGKEKEGNEPAKRQRIPASLNCYYDITSPRDKLRHLVELISRHPGEKMIVYFMTCACVDYYRRLPLASMVASVTKARGAVSGEIAKSQLENARVFLALHGKLPQAKRERALAQFSKSGDGILLCTDVAARGIDIPDVDWVVQFDPPQDPDAYIHRVGRTARLGRSGCALLYLAPSEDAYVDFLKIRKCPVRPLPSTVAGSTGSLESFEACDNGMDSEENMGMAGEEAKGVVEKMLRAATLADRAVLEASEAAFLSYIRAYKEHKCRYLLKLEEVDINSIAESFGLLRLPRFHEFKRMRAKIKPLKNDAISIRDIAFKDKARERHRQGLIRDAVENRGKRREVLQAKSKKGKKKKNRRQSQNGVTSGNIATTAGRGVKRDSVDDEEEEDDFSKEAAQLRKLKRGKLSHKDFDAATSYAE